MSAVVKTGPASWHPPDRPEWVEALNVIGEGAGGPAAFVPMEGNALLATARRATGLEDLGDDTWETPFGVLLDAIEGEAELHSVGRLVTRAEILRLLTNRLRIVETLSRSPEILDEPIEQPIFITGTARSGTSILHELLAQDSRFRSPAAWETLYSVPPPETASYDSDPRIAHTDLEVTFWHAISPSYSTMHSNAGDLPHECIFLMAHEFASDHFTGVLQIPSYAKWMATNDLRPAFGFHRRMLQLLQWRCPGERWLLKAPSHLSVLPSLLSLYPDARIVLTHRDPQRTVPSTVSLMATLRHMRRDDVDVDTLANQMALGMAFVLDRIGTSRQDGTLPEDRFVDVHYAALMADPIGTVRALYERLDLELSPESADRMRAYLEARPRNRHGPHRYSPADFGLDAAALGERYRGYVERFGVESED